MLFLEVYSAIFILLLLNMCQAHWGLWCKLFSSNQQLDFSIYRVFQIVYFQYYGNSRGCLPHTQMHKALYYCIAQWIRYKTTLKLEKQARCWYALGAIIQKTDLTNYLNKYRNNTVGKTSYETIDNN